MNSRLSALLAAALFLVGGVAVSSAPAKTAKCIVSGKEIEVTEKTPRVLVQGKAQYFCCENCPKAFAKEPEKYVKEVGKCPILGTPVMNPNSGERVVLNNALWYLCCANCTDGAPKEAALLKSLTDVVSGKAFKGSDESPRSVYKEQQYVFESADTKAAFDKDPAKYAVVFGK